MLGGTRAPRGLVFVGDPDPVLGGTVPVGGTEADKNNFAPRVGLAYSFGEDNFFNCGLFKTILGENQTVIAQDSVYITVRLSGIRHCSNYRLPALTERMHFPFRRAEL